MEPPPPQLRPPHQPSLSPRRVDAPLPASSSTRAPQKVAIPRLATSQRSSKGGGSALAAGVSPGSPGSDGLKNRVSHACEPCRQRKTKCSGEKPQCKHCVDFKLKCVYGDGKRDRAKNEMADLRRRVEVYEEALNQLKSQLDSAGQLLISKALQGFRTFENSEVEIRDGESLVLADVASTGSVDHIVEEIDTENAPYRTGYIGKTSEISWIQRVARQLATEAQNNSPGEVDDEYQFETPAYHLDDINLSTAGTHIDPFLLPDKVVADELVNVFFSTIHPTFPLLQQKSFMEQYETFFSMWFPPNNSKRWLAMLNLIFAIGSVYGKLVNAPWKGGDNEHLKFFGRARVLNLDEGGMLEVADVQQVQVVALTSIYLLVSNQTNRTPWLFMTVHQDGLLEQIMVEVFINDRVVGRELNEEFRAWNTIGLAVRYAQTLGLYLRNDVPVLAETEKEMRARMWFALYSLEHRLCLMTGRPSAICDQDCSVPLPRPIDEEFCGMVPFEDALRNYNRSLHGSNDDSTSGYSGPFSNQFTPISSVNTKQSSSTSGPSTHSPLSTPQTSTPQPYLPVTGVATTALYFYHHIKLVRITSEVLSSLYSPSAFTRTWSDLQGIISNLELKIQQWRNDLPASLSSDVPGPTRHRTALAFQYHHARVLINRPCLRRLDLRVPNESDRSRSFNRTAATTCISAAREMVNLIPENSSATELLAIAPWWGLLHYLVTAAAILLVEISMRAEHNPQIADNLLSDVKKIIRWLRSMSVNSIAAERSWAVLVKLLMICAPKIGGDTSDVDRNLPHPHVNRTQPSEQRGPLQATVDMSPYLFRQLFDEASGISFFDTSGGQFPQASPTFPIDTIPIPPQQSPTGSHILSSRSASNHPSSPLRSQIPPILRSLSSSTTINPTPSSSMSSSLPLHSLNLPQPQPMDVGMSTVSSQESQPPIPPRAKKRLSLGVGNIELPPRPDLAPLWSLRGSDEAKNAEYLNLARESVEADGVVKGKGEKRDR